MGTVKERKLGAVIGAAVADSAGQPIHWIYDHKKLDEVLGDKDDIEYLTPSANPFYTREIGKQSCYGDQAFVLLESLVASKGLNMEDLTNRHYKQFGPGSEYEHELIDTGVKKDLPVKGPWIQKSVKHLVKQVQAKNKNTGSSDIQMDCCAKLAPLVALYAGEDNLLDMAEEVIRLTQDNDITVSIGLAYARLLEHYILHGGDKEAVDKTITSLLDPKRKNPQDLDRHVSNLMKEVLNHLESPHRKTAFEQFKIS